MPFIFPKRFLRTRDILDPREMNDDTRPVQELLDGSLDRHNFDAAHLKATLTHTPTATTPRVGQYAYHNTKSVAVECFYKIDRTPGGISPNTHRHPPNFVKPDGATLRDTYAGTASDGKPFVVPNTGEWAAVKNADLSGPMQATFTTSRSRVWICAYTQYIYEFKPPWITPLKAATAPPEFDVSGATTGWGGPTAGFNAYLPKYERNVLNAFGPDDEWESYPNDYTASSLAERSYPYSFPLNEPIPKHERERPNLGGMHHISKGFYPALIQFALRIDGKIVDESITGKALSFEESVHGLKVNDSPVMSSGDDSFTFGQRSHGIKMSYRDTNQCRPGQKIRSSRAVACGPEVMPVRIGAVVPLEPGDHTVEIVVRRLQRKRKKFEVGDFVGVFSRRLVCLDLPMQATRQHDVAVPLVTPTYQTEDKVKEETLGEARVSLQDRVNAIEPQDLYRGVLPNTHLPSKVNYAQSVAITPSFSLQNTGRYASTERTRARFPGFKNTSYIDRVVSGSMSGWGTPYTDATGAGWYKLVEGATALQIAPTGSELTVTASVNELFLFADIELRGIHPLRSERGNYAASQTTDMGAGGRHETQAFRSFLQHHKYLDYFALFAIGYRVGSDPTTGWTIASEFAPAIVNSFNWANRTRDYVVENARGLSIFSSDGLGASSAPPTFSETPSLARDRRGSNTTSNNTGVNIPLFAHINDTKLITEVAVFASSTFSSDWDNELYSAPSERPYRDSAGVDRGDVWYQWMSPVYGRHIIDGLDIDYGNSKLTALNVAL